MNAQNPPKSCRCHDRSILIVERNNASRLVALFLLTGVSLFVGGFFWGKHHALDDMRHHINNDSLADQIYFALSTEPMLLNAENKSGEPTLACTPAVETISYEAPTVLVDSGSQETASERITNAVPTMRYHALLFGGTQKQVQAVADRLALHDITTIVKERVSSTKQGKKRTWYQLVTPPYERKEDLLSLVERIKRHERLNERIVHA